MTDYLRRDEFEEPIVQVLHKMGGQGYITDVLARVEEIMRPRLTAADYAPGPGSWSHRPRWELEARWARDRLGDAGIILPAAESGRGTWCLARPGAQVWQSQYIRHTPTPRANRGVMQQTDNAATGDEPRPDTSVVRLGSTVILDLDGDEMTYIVVSTHEAQPRQGRISDESPVGKALLGHKVGDIFEIDTPAATLRVIIKDMYAAAPAYKTDAIS